MILSHLTINRFRNLQSIDLDVNAAGLLLSGKNGSGKTNFLEAIHVLCTGRSQRHARRTEMVGFEQDACCVQGAFIDETRNRRSEAVFGFSRGKELNLQIDGAEIASLSHWFGLGMVVSFGPDDLQLIYGPPPVRRRFLDMLISQFDPEYLRHCIAYKKSLLNRNRLLGANVDETHVRIYEERLAEHGAHIVEKRMQVIDFIKPLMSGFYYEMSGGSEHGEVKYKPDFSATNSGKNEWKNVFLKVLQSTRKKDAMRGFTTLGPHRDDITLSVHDKPAKMFGSQGQCRSLALSLRLCSIECLERFNQQKMIFLVDDAFSELDDGRIARILPLIENRGQLFISTPAKAVPITKKLSQITVDQGCVTAL
ncbi:MAG: DNA replication and repair protein RecF [Chitinivibrionales bacterium]|nr:DNA replication and repair protein RecF [Chitinivibrionales bacterium]